MKLEDFKKATGEQIKEYGEKIPYGSTYDDNVNELTWKDEKDWWEKTYHGKLQTTYKDSKGDWKRWTYNERGQELTTETSDGYWTKRTYDEDGKILTTDDSSGYWCKYAYDEDGKTTCFEDSFGNWNESVYYEGEELLSADEEEYTIKGNRVQQEVYEAFKKNIKRS